MQEAIKMYSDNCIKITWVTSGKNIYSKGNKAS